MNQPYNSQNALHRSNVLAQRLLSMTDPSQLAIAWRTARDAALYAPAAAPVVYVPAVLKAEELIYLLHNPYSLDLSDQNNNVREPVYGSLLDALQGRNADTSHHVGFVLIGESSLFGTFIEDLVNREKVSKLPTEFRRDYLGQLLTLSQVCKPLAS